ncbi:hypothetical protein Tco_0321770 [Tanacetum coccineum]
MDIVPTEMELVLETNHPMLLVMKSRVKHLKGLKNEKEMLRIIKGVKKEAGIVPTEMELVLEQTQQGTSHEVSLADIEKVAVRSSLRSLKPKRTIESRVKRSSINLIRTLFHFTYSSQNVKTRIIIRVLRIILVVHIKMEMVSSCSGRDKFITACSYLTNTFKEIMIAQAYVSKLPQL